MLFAIDVPNIKIPNLNPLHYLNPFEWLHGQLRNLFNGLVTDFEKVFINPPRPNVGNWSNYLYGNAIGSSGYLVITVTVLLIGIAMVNQKRIGSVLDAIIIMVFILTTAPFWFVLCDGLTNAGIDLAREAMFYHSSNKHSLLWVPGIDSTLGYLAGIGSVTILGGILIGIFYLYALIVVNVKVFGLLALAALPLGQRARKFWNWVVSMGLVTMLFGRALAVFSVELGKVMADNVPIAGKTAFADVLFVTISLIAAIVLQGFLIYWTHNAINNITGRTHSEVRGWVETMQRRQQNVGTSPQVAHLNTKKVQDVRVVQQSAASRTRQALAEPAKRAGTAALMKAAGSVHPAAAAAIAAKSATNKPRTPVPSQNDNHKLPREVE